MEAFYSKQMNDNQLVIAEMVRDRFAGLAQMLEASLYQGRYKSIVMTKLEEAAMFATKSITHEWKE